MTGDKIFRWCWIPFGTPLKSCWNWTKGLELDSVEIGGFIKTAKGHVTSLSVAGV